MDYEDELQRLYSTHAPSKVEKIPELLFKYQGRWELLLDAVRSKYGDHPKQREASAPPASVEEGAGLASGEAGSSATPAEPTARDGAIAVEQELRALYTAYAPEKLASIPR